MGEAKRRKLAGKKPTVGLHRLVILEWLKDNEWPTGTLLTRRLLKLAPELPVQCIKCRSASDVLKEIQRLTADVLATGNVPILQIEAHGYEDENKRGAGLAGPSGAGSTERLPWDDLARELRKVNVATRFNLVFVGAACLSDCAVYTATAASGPLPFVIAVGFVDEVSVRGLLKSMVSFHSGVLIDGAPFQLSAETAMAKLNPTTEALAWFSLPLIIRNAGLDAAVIVADPSTSVDLYMRMLGDLAGQGRPPIAPDVFHRDRTTYIPRAINKIIGALLAYDRVPENRTRFGFDGDKLAREARRTNHKPSAGALERAERYRSQGL